MLTVKRFIDKSSGKLVFMPANYKSAGGMPQVVILAGGLGTRLGDLTKQMPKSLIQVGNQSILSHILDWINEQGCDRALILTGHLGEQFDDFSHHSVSLTFVKESEPLGTGGALWNAVDYLEDNFIMLWGDDLHPIDYQKLLLTHQDGNNLMTMTVTKSHFENNLRYDNGFVINYDKESLQSNNNGYEAGTSIVSKKLVLLFGRDGKWSWEQTVYPALAGKIRVHNDDTKFWDMGTPERLANLSQFLKQWRS